MANKTATMWRIQSSPEATTRTFLGHTHKSTPSSVAAYTLDILYWVRVLWAFGWEYLDKCRAQDLVILLAWPGHKYFMRYKNVGNTNKVGCFVGRLKPLVVISGI